MVDAPGPSRWIWGRGLAAYCDWRIPDEFADGTTFVASSDSPLSGAIPDVDQIDLIDEPDRFAAIQDGALVWVRGAWLPSFVARVLPRLQARIVLVTGDSDAPMPSAVGAMGQALLDSPRIIHWYTQNYDGSAPTGRVSPLPIGLDFHTLTQRPEWGESVASVSEQHAQLDAIVASLPPLEARVPEVYVDFSWQARIDSPRSQLRTPQIRALSRPLVAHQEEPLPRSEMWRHKGQYAFSFSPHGFGLDCHRTWEGLALGQIVLVPRSSLLPLFEGTRAFPLAAWDDLTMPNLVRWLARAGELADPDAPLTNRYWIARMRTTSTLENTHGRSAEPQDVRVATRERDVSDRGSGNR